MRWINCLSELHERLGSKLRSKGTNFTTAIEADCGGLRASNGNSIERLPRGEPYQYPGHRGTGQHIHLISLPSLTVDAPAS